MSNQKQKKDPLLQKINEDITEVKGIMKNNIQKVIHNNEDLEEIQVVSDELKKNAKQFKKDAREAKKVSRSCSPKIVALIVILCVIIVAVIAYFVVALIRCGSANAFCE